MRRGGAGRLDVGSVGCERREKKERGEEWRRKGYRQGLEEEGNSGGEESRRATRDTDRERRVNEKNRGVEK